MTGGQDRTIKLWNPHKGTMIKTYKGVHGYEVLDIAMYAPCFFFFFVCSCCSHSSFFFSNHENSRFASAGADKVIFVWDVATGEVERRHRGHTQVCV